MPDKSPPRLSWPRLFAAVLFPVALWFIATFFLLGDTGKYNDDWYYVQRDPASGAIQSLTLERPVHFWRPLYRIVVPTLLTLLTDLDWLNHLISAAVHGLVGNLLWRVMRTLNVVRVGAAIAALWFVVWPSHFEAVLWLCALPTLLSTALVIASWLLIVRLAQHKVGFWSAPAAALLIFGSACLNEQASCAFAALPFLYMAARPVAEPTSRSLARAAVPTLLSGLSLVAYVILHVQLKFKMPALNHDSVVIPLADMPHQAALVSGWLRGQFLSGGFLTRLLQAGAAAITEYPVRACLLALAVMVGLPLWAASVGRETDETLPHSTGARAGWLLAAGLTTFAASLAPIVAFNYWLVPRITYAPSLGVALIIAGLFSIGPIHRGASADRFRAAVALVAGLGLAAASVMMIGCQLGYRNRARQDRMEARQLMNLVPSPDANTVFVPLRIAPPHATGGAARFDGYFASALSSWWSAGWFLRLEYRRSDISCGYCLGNTPGITHISTDVASVRDIGDIAWPHVVPFIIDEAGKVKLVTHVRSGSVVVPAEQAIQAAKTNRLPHFEFQLP